MPKPFVSTTQGGYGSKPGRTEFTQTPLRKMREEAAGNAFTPREVDLSQEDPRETISRIAPSTMEAAEEAEAVEDAGDTGYDTGDTGDDTGEVGDRFGGTFGAERVEAVAMGEDWSQDVKDAVHGMREKLGGDYEFVEAVGNPPTEIIFGGPNGQQYSVEYGTGHTEELSPEQRTPYGLNDELGEVSQRWLDTGDTGE